MSGIEFYTNSQEFQNTMSAARATIITPFFANNVEKVKDLKQAYNMAKKSKGTIVLKGRKIFKPEKIGLPKDSEQLIFNDGSVVGRCTAARKIVGDPNCDTKVILPIIRDAIFNTRYKKMYKAQTIVGLDEKFMIKANLLIPEGYENTLYSWMLNFQYINKGYQKRYKKSEKINQGDIFVFSDPDWSHPDFPYGLTFFDPEHNCAAILGMKYFGEHKKGTLTLAWGSAAKAGFAACHGGMKRYNLKSKKSKQLAFFGLSGSGKSTLTHAKHHNKYDITVLHDDAFVIDVEHKYSIALEPAYFDKTQDYPMGCDDNKFILTQQNVGAISDKNGKMYAITEDIRNGNGRAIKSKLWSPNRVDIINEKINAIFWLMKDPTLPPVLKVTGSDLSSAMGATLATKRSTAEVLATGIDPDALVIEPYANPFRVYPLSMDYLRFKQLFDDGVDCYILNTGCFMGKKITPEITLNIIENIVDNNIEFKPFYNATNLQYCPITGFEPDFSNPDYMQQFKQRFSDRINFVQSRETFKDGIDKLPKEAQNSLEQVLEEFKIEV